MSDLQEAYDKLPFALPSFDTLNSEFEIDTIEHTSFLIREIVRRMQSSLEEVMKIIEELLHPESSLSSMIEAEALSDEQRKAVLSLYRALGSRYKQGLIVLVNHDEQAMATYIAQIVQQWSDVRTQVAQLLSTVKQQWDKEQTEEEDNGYFG